MERLEVRRPKNRIIDKIMELGLVSQRSQLYKKKTKKSGGGNIVLNMIYQCTLKRMQKQFLNIELNNNFQLGTMMRKIGLKAAVLKANQIVLLITILMVKMIIPHL